MATYPSGIKTFTTKQDQLNVVYANDMNDVQTEITSVETTLGADPQVVNNGLDRGRHVDYGTVKNRLEAMQANLSSPAIYLTKSSYSRPSRSFATLTSWSVTEDHFGYASASGLTTKDESWWLIHVNGEWDVNSSGYRVFTISFDGSEMLRDTRLASSAIGTPMGQHITYFARVPETTRVQVGLYQTSGHTLTCRHLEMTALLMKRPASYFTSTTQY
jgi:hypothetical protein